RRDQPGYPGCRRVDRDRLAVVDGRLQYPVDLVEDDGAQPAAYLEAMARRHPRGPPPSTFMPTARDLAARCHRVGAAPVAATCGPAPTRLAAIAAAISAWSSRGSSSGS